MNKSDFFSRVLSGKKRTWALMLAGFLTATLWIGAADLGVFPVETCIARYFICFTAVCVGDYLMSKNKSSLIPFYKQGLIILALSVLAYAITLCLKKAGILHAFSIHWIVFVFGALLLIYVFFLYIKKRISCDFYLACIVFIIGTVYACSYPIGTGISWDDQDHYKNILQISHFNDANVTEADSMLIYSAMPGEKNTVTLLQEGKTEQFYIDINNTYKRKEKAKIKLRDISLGVALTYIPETVSIFLARGIGIPYSYVFALGRWIGVLVFSIVFYYSLVHLKTGKLVFYMIAMLPITVFLMSNYSYDTWAMGFSMLAFAYYLGIMQDEGKKMHMKDIAIICILFILAYSAKPTYFMLILAVLFIDDSKMSEDLSKKKYYAFVIATSAIVMASFVIPYLVAGTGGNDMRGGEGIDTAKQIQFIFGNPMEYTKILLEFLKEYWAPVSLAGYIGFLAFLGFANHTTAFMIFAIIIIMLDKSREEVRITTAKRRIWTFLLAFAASCLFATIMYLAFTPVGSDTINGCQGRYILPLLPFVLYYIGDFRLVARIRNHIADNALVLTASVVSTVYAFYCIYSLVLCYY